MKLTPLSSHGPEAISALAASAQQKRLENEARAIVTRILHVCELADLELDQKFKLLVERVVTSETLTDCEKGKMYALLILEGLKIADRSRNLASLGTKPFFAQRRRHEDSAVEDDNNIYLRNPRVAETESRSKDRLRKMLLYEADLVSLHASGNLSTTFATNPRRATSIKDLDDFFTRVIQTWPG